MKNRVTITLGNQSYTLISTEDSMYMQQVAAHVNDELARVTNEAHLSIADAAMLTAMKTSREEIFALFATMCAELHLSKVTS